ncbi:MAG: hypothetical protein Q9176_008007 [Flavoplaca citrina]
MTDAAKGFITDGFPARGLRKTHRLITGHGADGRGHFLVTDNCDHHRVMGDKAVSFKSSQIQEAQPIRILTLSQPGLHIPSGSVVRLIDFGPGVESPLHRAMSIDYGIVLEGEFELSLDSGELRIMRRGNISVQRATAHRWRNIIAGGTEPGRMLYVLLDCKDVFLKNGEKVEGFLGELEKEYEGRSA